MVAAGGRLASWLDGRRDAQRQLTSLGGRSYLRCTLGDDSDFNGSAAASRLVTLARSDDAKGRMTTMHARAQRRQVKGRHGEVAAVRDVVDSSDGRIHTFGFCHGRKTTFGVLGGGHVGGRGRGSSGLGCGCHSLGW